MFDRSLSLAFYHNLYPYKCYSSLWMMHPRMKEMNGAIHSDRSGPKVISQEG
ncbi:hypothetical protein ASZ90_011514 [hydrocarbon metagenome]|uniref:Uncharacterized protein n=1 Tax=hydrocarbon metagenome TaxID=938273 RepID=A0A0W8FD01_9ZZZZ